MVSENATYLTSIKNLDNISPKTATHLRSSMQIY